ncbi:hypothetical protein J6590_031406 [Homalodisca vitripennis]|nr:hypothetical protein J6590_031406 [Homalodisca vitripennis]
MIVGGLNSINTEEEDKIELLLNTLLTKISDTTNVVLTTIPHRYDQPYLNSTIHEINKKIYKTAAHHKTSFLPINNLITREHFTRRGLHLNKQGKDVLCTSIALHATIRLHSKTTTKAQNTTTSCIPPNKKYDGEKPISVVETNMKNAIQDFRGDESVAFAHTISSDLGNKRNMTAGVAVVFREEFDLWRGKRVQSYNKVGVQWEANGLRLRPGKGLKRLVCSAMGCVRDLVAPDRLIANLTKFQEATGAIVNIISYNQYSTRSLWNGLSHNSFVKKLNNLIAFQHVQNASPVSSLVPSSNPIIPLASGNSSHTHILPPTVLPSPHPQQSTQTNQTPEVDTNQSFLENLSLFPPL